MYKILMFFLLIFFIYNYFNSPTLIVDNSLESLCNICKGGNDNVRLPPIYSPDGSIICIIKGETLPITLHDSSNGALVLTIPCNDVVTVEFSPLGNYLVTWSRQAKINSDNGAFREGNLKVY
jgi:hypothetical protein